MFLNYPSPGSPLVLLGEKFGNPGYIIPYLLFVWGVIISMSLIGQLVIRAKDIKHLQNNCCNL